MKYFSIEELCKSSTADELGIKNTPDALDSSVERIEIRSHIRLLVLRKELKEVAHIHEGHIKLIRSL